MKRILVALLLGAIASTALGQDKGKPGVAFVEPKNRATVGQEFKVVMSVKGMTVKPAGDMTEKTGHHHLLIDADPVKKGDVIPADASHVHFGKGQTETTLKLPPGKHKLQLQFADGAHRSYGKTMSATITVTVK